MVGSANVQAMHDSLGPPDPPIKTASRSSQPFFHNSRSLPTGRPTDRQNDHETCPALSTGRLRCGATPPNSLDARYCIFRTTQLVTSSVLMYNAQSYINVWNRLKRTRSQHTITSIKLKWTEPDRVWTRGTRSKYYISVQRGGYIPPLIASVVYSGDLWAMPPVGYGETTLFHEINIQSNCDPVLSSGYE